MGEIGIARKEFLYELDFTDILLIERGYERRAQHLWSSIRWQTFHMMSAFCGSKALRESNINHPHDLLPLPWDTTEEPVYITPEEKRELEEDMRNFKW